MRRFAISRDGAGVSHIQGASLVDAMRGMGFAHATDRGMQMLFMRILGRGRVAEMLDPSDSSVAIDTFFRRMNWADSSEGSGATFGPEAAEIQDAYCDGVNEAFSRRIPWELRILGYDHDIWTVADTVLISRMTGYLTLAQSQAEMERLFVEMVQAGVEEALLHELFPGVLEGCDFELLREVSIHDRVVPSEIAWCGGPRLMASNNWVVAGVRTVSGAPLLANDTHLEINRLPNIWYETVLSAGGRWGICFTMPGMPGMLNGRTADLSWGVTYAFMDSVDSWIERCKDGKYYREESADGEEWHEFRVRREDIKRKKGPSTTVTFYENEHGVLDGDPTEQGYYLATRWSGSNSGPASLDAMGAIWGARRVEEAMDLLGRVESAWNWVLADTSGDIGYQMSGLLPRRREGWRGFVPVEGWKPENDWRGFVGHEDLPRILNPPEGFFATANEDLNRYGVAKPITLPMAPYRGDRIREVLGSDVKSDVTGAAALQCDVVSLQARRFMEVLEPLLPASPQGDILRGWNCTYDVDSQGAYLFEEVYRELLVSVFGTHCGTEVLQHLLGETGVFTDFYESFDRVLLSGDSGWFDGRSQEQVFREAAQRALVVRPRRWGDTRRITLSHILFGGKMPRFLGFDRGPIELMGGRATVHQGQIYRSAGRTTTFAPSQRLIADMAEDALYTNLAGGPSDRRFSRWYCSDLENWRVGRYRRVVPVVPEAERRSL